MQDMTKIFVSTLMAAGHYHEILISGDFLVDLISWDLFSVLRHRLKEWGSAQLGLELGRMKSIRTVKSGLSHSYRPIHRAT
jgi:hypothetical protein